MWYKTRWLSTSDSTSCMVCQTSRKCSHLSLSSVWTFYWCCDMLWQWARVNLNKQTLPQGDCQFILLNNNNKMIEMPSIPSSTTITIWMTLFSTHLLNHPIHTQSLNGKITLINGKGWRGEEIFPVCLANRKLKYTSIMPVWL